jgi:sensor histidine kinase YesM
MKKNQKNTDKKVPIEKTERKKTNWKLVRELLSGYRRYIVFASISVLLSTAFSYAVPYVTSFTLDYVIQGITTSTPKFLLPWIESLGGRRILRAICSSAVLRCSFLPR